MYPEVSKSAGKWVHGIKAVLRLDDWYDKCYASKFNLNSDTETITWDDQSESAVVVPDIPIAAT